MTSAVRSMVATAYVRDLDAARAFYELLGFEERSADSDATSAWSCLHQGDLRVLLACIRPSLQLPRLPLLFYLFCDNVDDVVMALETAGVPTERRGHPPHAPGGEVKVLDPDGNTVLIGQAERSRPGCGVPGLGGTPCREPAKVKLADSAGDSVWACLDHADEILLTISGAFIASDETGIADFVARRGRTQAGDSPRSDRPSGCSGPPGGA